eukprot:447948_1
MQIIKYSFKQSTTSIQISTITHLEPNIQQQIPSKLSIYRLLHIIIIHKSHINYYLIICYIFLYKFYYFHNYTHFRTYIYIYLIKTVSTHTMSTKHIIKS